MATKTVLKYKVASFTNSRRNYTVIFNGTIFTCTCPDFVNRQKEHTGETCKHIDYVMRGNAGQITKVTSFVCDSCKGRMQDSETAPSITVKTATRELTLCSFCGKLVVKAIDEANRIS